VTLRIKRRRYRRMTVRLEAVYVQKGVERAVVATTLGAGGLFVASDDPLAAGTRLRIRFHLPGGIRDHELDARVVWAHREGDPGSQGHGMGLSFTNPAQSALLATELDAMVAAEEAEAARAEARQGGEPG
jgi:uncharacterized protein (TIGR02266 family)